MRHSRASGPELALHSLRVIIFWILNIHGQTILSAEQQRLQDASPYDESILRALRRIIRAVDLYSRQLSIRHSLTGPQLVCLRQLVQQGPMTPGRLAREVSLSPATISGILDRLERRGYVTRSRRPEDKRQVLVAITTRGRELTGRTPPPLHERFTRRLAELPESRQAEIHRVLGEVVEMMEADDIEAAPLLASWPVGGEARRESELNEDPGRPGSRAAHEEAQGLPAWEARQADAGARSNAPGKSVTGMTEPTAINEKAGDQR